MADNWLPDPSNQNQVKATATKVSSQGGQDVGAQNVTLYRLNGTTAEPTYNNTEGTLLASAARTATTSSPNQTNYNARGVLVTLDVTAASGTGGLTVRLLAVDPASGKTVGLNVAPTAITATGTYAYLFFPGVTGPNLSQASSTVVPRTWKATVFHGDSSSYTYSVGYALIV